MENEEEKLKKASRHQNDSLNFKEI